MVRVTYGWLCLMFAEASYIAPTGGGKTVLFELALIKLLMTNGQHATSKCVYVAPTKVSPVMYYEEYY